MTIKLFEPRINERLKTEVMKVIESGQWYSGESKLVRRFERKLRDYLGCYEVIAVNSGTSALHLSCSLFKNKLAHVPALSFVSTASAPKLARHKIKFSDINIRTLHIKGQYIYENNSLFIPVHFGGLVENYASRDVPIIEDCAHAMGSKFHSKNIRCFSFHAIKNLSMPTGGAIAVHDDGYVDELREKRWCGISVKNGKRDVKRLGWNYVMNDISAVMGIEQLRILDDNNYRRKRIAKRYHDELEIYDKMPYNPDCAYHLYWILVKDRNEFRSKMAEMGIETGYHYPSIDRFSMFKEAHLPTTHYVSDHIVTLPIHPNLKSEDLDRVIKSANSLV